MPVIFVISVAVSIVWGMISLSWFYRNADESTDSFNKYYESSSWGQPWWATKFGWWLGLSIGVGVASYHLLPLALVKAVAWAKSLF